MTKLSYPYEEGKLKGWSKFNPHSVRATEFYSWKEPQRCSHSIQFLLKTKQLKPVRLHDSSKVIHLLSAKAGTRILISFLAFFLLLYTSVHFPNGYG